MQVNVIEFPAKVALLKHLGAPGRIFETVSKFIQWRKQSGLSPMATSKTFGIPHSDPNLTAPDKYRWDVCSSVEQDVPENAFGVETSTIPCGRCAVIRHKGSHLKLDRCIYYIYQQWLPSNNEETRDFPCYFHYHNFIHQVDECDLLSDIYVPLK